MQKSNNNQQHTLDLLIAYFAYCLFHSRGQQESNLHRVALQTTALPLELHPLFSKVLTLSHFSPSHSWVTSGLEPCSSRPQRGVLPVKLRSQRPKQDSNLQPSA